MGYIERICPHCQEKMQVPEELDTAICMYCGKSISFAKEPCLDAGAQEEAFVKIREELPKMLLSLTDGFQNFKRDTYPERFQKAYRSHIDTLTAIEELYQGCADKEEAVGRVAGDFIAEIEGSLAAIPKKNTREKYQMEYNLMMVAYVLPAIMEYKGDSSQPLAQELAGRWRQAFKNSEINVATFEQINSGFRRKLCYVTTAVCESMGKGPDCYELTVLKNYRDSYLLYEEDGEELVRRYYDIAPTIVKRIEKKENAAQIYKDIYKQYISPCISLIENERNEECKELYVTMVQKLQAAYMGQERQ